MIPSPTRRPFLRFRRVAGTMALAVAGVTGAALVSAESVALKVSDPLSEPWQAAARLLVNDANRQFAAGDRSAAGSSRENRFGEAVTLLNVQPKTRANIERAHRLLTALREENWNDDFGIMAGYYLGRIEQVHRSSPNLRQALDHYEILANEHPAHLFAQMAAVKACVLRLYAVDNAVPPERRLEQAAARRPLFTLPETRRDYHLVMADACARLGGPAVLQMDHLLAAEEAGQLDRNGRADLAVRVAELARGLGQKDRAIAYYRKFLAEYSREVRVHLVQQRLRELEAQP